MVRFFLRILIIAGISTTSLAFVVKPAIQLRSVGFVSAAQQSVSCKQKAEEGLEPADNLLQGALLRIGGTGIISTFAAWEFHSYFTGPMSKIELVDSVMLLTEISVIGIRNPNKTYS